MAMPLTYESECYALAEHFVEIESTGDDLELQALYCHDLALAIQQAVDTFFFTRTPMEVPNV